jgi:hypothetical protein
MASNAPPRKLRASSTRNGNDKATKSGIDVVSPTATMTSKKISFDDKNPAAKAEVDSKEKADLTVSDGDISPLEVIPEEYRKNGIDAEPQLFYLPRMTSNTNGTSLDDLLDAAQKDVRLHQARIRAALLNQPTLLTEYDYEKDTVYISRQQRLKERMEMVEILSKESRAILRDLNEERKNLTPAERMQVKLAQWQRALELYVYCPSEMTLDLLGLLEKLLDGTSEVSLTHSFILQQDKSFISLALKY